MGEPFLPTSDVTIFSTFFQISNKLLTYHFYLI